MILLSKVFLRLLNSFDAISRRETSTAPQRKSQKRISRQLFLFTSHRWKYFFAYGRRSIVFRCHFKSAEYAGNFVVCSLEVRLASR